jgi:hypothetical protein
VNEFTIDLGAEGLQAIEMLVGRAADLAPASS